MAKITHINTPKTFTLQEAQELLPVVRRITTEAAGAAERLTVRHDALPEEHPERAELENKLNELLQHWGEKVGKLGCHAKGLWLVDFDNGHGYYCWQYPETVVTHFHEYDGGFSGRQQIN